jgi:hypothetical protein
VRALAIILGILFILVALFGNPHIDAQRHPERYNLAPNPGVIDWLAEAEYQRSHK